MRRQTTYSVYEVVPVVITDRAVKLVVLDDPECDPEGVWVPKSCVHEQYRDAFEVGVVEAVEIADWLAEQEGFAH
jgi:hypothetical protein